MLKTKALYNLLRMNARQDPSIKAESWALENLRSLGSAELWKRLSKLSLALDQSLFIQYAEKVDSPEELTELLTEEEMDPKDQDRVYLLIFELWRRILPERPSLSIFCDELDHQFDLYDTEQLASDEAIQDGFSNLIDVLEEHVDAGLKPKEAFAALADYCAHDLESFLYDYIDDLLDQENSAYASELLEQFEPFIVDTNLFEVLQVRILALNDIGDANRRMEKLLSKKLTVECLFEALRYLVVSGEEILFRSAIEQLLSKIETEDELNDALELSAEYFRRLDHDELEQAILKIQKHRKPRDQKIHPSDPDLKKLKEITLR